MKYMTKQWYQKMQKEIYVILEEDENAKYFKEVYQLEKEKWIAIFEERYKENLQMLKDLPPEIMKEVADIRLLALEHAPKKVITMVDKYNMENDRIIKKAFEDYNKEFKREFKEEKPKFTEESFHDADVITFEKVGNDYIMKLDNEEAFTTVEKVTFKDAKIVKKDGNIEDTTWIYEEFYKKKEAYEVHILFRKENPDNLLDMIIECKDIYLS